MKQCNTSKAIILYPEAKNSKLNLIFRDGHQRQLCADDDTLAGFCEDEFDQETHADVVRNSAVVNQLVGDYDGSLVDFFDWSSVFDETTTAIKGISTYHHFCMSRNAPGCVFVRRSSDDCETKINILHDSSWKPSINNMPPLITPPRLSLEHQWYLYNKIREFCPDQAKDLVCPMPSQPL